MDFTNDPLNDEIRDGFLGKCPHSSDSGNYCPFATNIRDDTYCSQLITWIPDLNIRHIDKCIMEVMNRKKVAYRNKYYNENPGSE
tara:strand:- start:133 stop:387 length:255 start_codon:yes stop_codon:yes gene_type:complete